MAQPIQYPERFLVQFTTEQRETLDTLHRMTGLSRSHWIRYFIDEGLAAFGSKIREQGGNGNGSCRTAQRHRRSDAACR